MNEETELTVGATEGTGDRPKKKTAAKKKVAKKTPTKKAAKKKEVGKKSSKSAPSPSTSTAPGKKTANKKGGAAKKSAAPVRASGGAKKSPTGSPVTPIKPIPKPKVKKAPAANVVIDYTTLKPQPLYGIARIDQESKKNHGWYVRMGPKKKGEKSAVIEWFADKRFGGKKHSFAAAKEFRDKEFAGLPDKLRLRGSRKRNKNVA